jgi:hypothetical protein
VRLGALTSMTTPPLGSSARAIAPREPDAAAQAATAIATRRAIED